MMPDRTNWVDRIALLRWVIPIAVACLGLGYMVFDQLIFERRALVSPYVTLSILLFGLVGPVLAWVTLDWAYKSARAEAQAQAETQRRVLQLETANQVSQKVAAILDMDELFSQVVRLIRDRFGYYYVALLLVEHASNELVLREGSGAAAQSLKARGLRLKIGEQGITGRVAQTGQAMLCNDVAEEPLFYSHDLLPETQSELAVPLRLGERVVGVLDVQSNQRQAFRPDDAASLQILADQVAIALENARLFRETRHQIRVMRVLHDISLDVTSHLDLGKVLAAILEQSARLLQAEASSLALKDPHTDLVRYVAVHNLPPEFTEVLIRSGEGVAGQVILTGQPLIINDYVHWQNHIRAFDSSPHDAVMGVPLRWHGEVFGVLDVLDFGTHRPFNDDDVQVLSLFADLASIALKNAELYAEVFSLTENLETQVEARTEELSLAREELAQQAAQLEKLLAITVHIQEEERSRIARDLHDGSNQLITGALYEIQAARESLLRQRSESVLEKLDTAKTLLGNIEAVNRRIIFDLRPPVLDAQGLIPAIKWYANTFYTHYGIQCLIQVSGTPVRFSPPVETAIFRIVQESLNNIAEHAQADCARLRVRFGPAKLSIMIEDAGVGFDNEIVRAAYAGRMGLIGMRERAKTIGGQVKVISRPGHGTRVVFELALPRAESEIGLAAGVLES